MKQDNHCYPWAVDLATYIIDKHSGNKAEFARVQGVKPQQITEWINKRFIVVDGVMYSPRRELVNEKI